MTGRTFHHPAALRDPGVVCIVGNRLFICLDTGTRNLAMRDLQWHISPDGGCFDLDEGLLHRRGFGMDPHTGKPCL